MDMKSVVVFLFLLQEITRNVSCNRIKLYGQDSFLYKIIIAILQKIY